jgi:MFS transporter, PAT family, beta-lactamase induction signal transducer AmpG
VLESGLEVGHLARATKTAGLFLSAPPLRSSAHPVWFLILFLPMGITNGYIVVTLGYLLTHAGIGVQTVAALVAVSMTPHMLKVLWAPLVDTTLSYKSWFLLSNLATGILMAATSLVSDPARHLLALDAMVFAFSLANTFNCMAADGLMAHATAPEEKGRAGGWSQAGNLGGTGIGGGAGLWLAQHVAEGWAVGAALGAACILTSLALLALKEPKRDRRQATYRESLAGVGRDVWDIARKRLGFLALVLMTLPIGVGAAQNLWAAVADDWHATADTVALVTGVLSGVVSMVGCILGGAICDRLDRKVAYNLFGLLSVACVAAMAFSPRSEAMYVVYTGAYAFVMGMSYAAFGAVVLEAIGTGAAATKYNLLAAIANMPITYQAMIDGWAHDKWGAGGMLAAEALAGVAAVLFFCLVAVASRPFARKA